MKKIILSFIVSLFSISSFCAGLLPADHSFCQPQKETVFISCKEGSSFMNGSDGRCGCLTPNDYLPIDTCMRAYIKCSENSPLTHLRQGDTMIGCGCLETIRM